MGELRMETRTFKHGDNEYAMLLPAPRPAMKLCNRVALLLGPALATLGKDLKEGGQDALGKALLGIDPDVVDALFMDAIKEAKVQYGSMNLADPILFTKHFDTNRGDIYPVCVWCLFECVKDFFPQLGAFAQVAKVAAEKAFQSPQDGK